MISNSPLQTDLYQLTMAAAYWQAGKAEQESVFQLYFRRLPFCGGYAIAAGLEQALEWLDAFRFGKEELHYLAGLRTRVGTPLFQRDFLDYLGDLRLKLDIDAIPEGDAVFAHEPLLRVQGPILHAQLVETALLNILNFQTLVATKAARICGAAADGAVVEFGYRRAQGPDGGLSASRAAYIGGCKGTSNVMAGYRYGIPVLGTHAHSWVMSFDEESEAFDRYAEAMPDNSTLLVDTYDTVGGVNHAIGTARKLRERGHELSGIRLDSGDLAWLSRKARTMLDAAGFPQVKIVASNDLDEHIIETLRHQGAQIDIWGVGTNLVTAADQPALGGVYKLVALRREDGTWQARIKRSEQSAKSSIPGRLQIRRYEQDGMILADAIYDLDRGIPDGDVEIIDPGDPIRRKQIPPGTTFHDVLRPVMKNGLRLAASESLEAIRSRCRETMEKVHPGIARLVNPHTYPAGLEQGLHRERERLLAEFR